MRVNHGSRLVFYSYRSVFIVTGRFFIVSGGFSGFFMAPGLVFMIPSGFLLSQVGLDPSSLAT